MKTKSGKLVFITVSLLNLYKLCSLLVRVFCYAVEYTANHDIISNKTPIMNESLWK